MDQIPQSNYIAIPSSGNGAGVLVLHAWWGRTQVICDLCDQLAAQGFTALAPDLYHGRRARTIAEAESLMQTLDGKQAASDVLAACDALRALPSVRRGGLGVIGFSMGASWAMWLAQQRPADVRAVTLFYGTGEDDFSSSQAAYQGHFAANDPYESAEYIAITAESMRQAQRPVEFHTYPDTGHWFFEPDRTDAYHAQAAALAWERTLTFLRQHLGDA